jgi:hypothetical protein
MSLENFNTNLKDWDPQGPRLGLGFCSSQSNFKFSSLSKIGLFYKEENPNRLGAIVVISDSFASRK